MGLMLFRNHLAVQLDNHLESQHVLIFGEVEEGKASGQTKAGEKFT